MVSTRRGGVPPGDDARGGRGSLRSGDPVVGRVGGSGKKVRMRFGEGRGCGVGCADTDSAGRLADKDSGSPVSQASVTSSAHTASLFPGGADGRQGHDKRQKRRLGWIGRALYARDGQQQRRGLLSGGNAIREGVGGRKEVQMQLPTFLEVVVVVAVVMVTALPPATGRQGVLSRPTPNPPINKIPRSTGWYRRNDGCLVCVLPKNTPRDMQRRGREPGEAGRGCSRVLFLLPNPKSQIPNPMGHPPSTSSADERIGMSQHPFGIEPKSNSWCDTGKRVARSLDRAAGYHQSRSASSRGFDGCRALRLETWGLIVGSLPCHCSSRGRGFVRRRDEGRLVAKTTRDDAVKDCSCSPTRAPSIFVCHRGPSVTETTPEPGGRPKPLDGNLERDGMGGMMPSLGF